MMENYTKALKLQVLIICSLGLFIDGFDLYITSVAAPLINHQIHVTAWAMGMIQAAAPIGATLGAIVIGRISDKVGRKSLLMFNLFFFVIAALLSGMAWNTQTLILFRFLVGFGVGADYPICAAYISEMAPKSSRGKMAAFAMFMNCMAAPVGIFIALIIFKVYPQANAWRIMLAFGAIPAAIGLVLRSKLPESFVWNAQKRMSTNSESWVENGGKFEAKKEQTNFKTLFSPQLLKITLIVSICWFLMDISYYGIALFTPSILEALHFSTQGNFITSTTKIVEQTMFVNVFIVIGALLSVLYIDKIGRIKLQKIGFFFSFIALIVLGMISLFFSTGMVGVMLMCFIMYNFFINFGPGITTWIIPAEMYPTKLRSTGQGFAAGMAKFGAFLGTLMLPVIQAKFGISAVVLGLAVTMLLGLILTFALPRETAHLSIEEIDENFENEQKKQNSQKIENQDYLEAIC